ncbi:MAG: cytochrome c-type biogenesis protein CcmH [Chloroflexi bacterium]|nr:cytochrome c-type biogenesis protein CcmH [Chloroflexota bacterium]
MDSVLLAAVLLVVAAALLSTLGLGPPSPAERERRLESELRCPVCQGLSIAESPAALAREMRGVVAERVAAGASDAEIRSYFVQRYGQWILLVPDDRGTNLVLWAFPGLLFLGGAGVIVARARRRGRRLPSEPGGFAGKRPSRLALATTSAIIVAAIAVPLAVALGPRSAGAEITGGRTAVQAAPSLDDLAARAAANPGDTGTLVALGDAYAGSGRAGDAADAYGRALKIEPDDVGALVGLSSLLLGAGRPDGALTLLNRAVAVAPALPDIYLLRSISRYQLAGAMTVDARADALRFLDLAPNDPRRTLVDELLAAPGPSFVP